MPSNQAAAGASEHLLPEVGGLPEDLTATARATPTAAPPQDTPLDTPSEWRTGREEDCINNCIYTIVSVIWMIKE